MFPGLFRLRVPRHPLGRLFAGALAVIAVLVLLALSMFALTALAIGGGVLLLVNAFRQAQAPASATPGRPAAPPAGVIEGEFSVVSDERRPRDAVR